MALSSPFSGHTSFFCFFFLLCFLKGSPVYSDKGQLKPYHVISVKSLDSDPYCIESPRDQSKKETLKVVHRHGPCSHLNEDQASTPTLHEIMSHDQSRVNSLQKRLRVTSDENVFESSKVTLPTESGKLIGTGNYVVTLGFGTPKKDLTLIFDTGSDVTWIQCRPCISCYQQQEPIFNPSKSQTYKNLTCDSQQCSQLQQRGCYTHTNTCIYGVNYGDGSFTRGFLATETLTVVRGSADVFPNFVFGCGVNNQGLFRGSAGLLGLGRNALSFVGQTASKYGNYFSYCLPTFSSSSGTLAFGKEDGPTNSASLKYTTLSTDPNRPSFYFIKVVAIKVGGQTLSISPSVFNNSGTIIDTGTVVTRLQPEAYSALRTSFRQQMMNYTMSIQAPVPFDTCYDFSGHDRVSIPEISFVFGGNVEVPIHSSGILYGNHTQACLAFAGNRDASEVGIFGNLQQQTLDVVYDVDGGKLGFGTEGCSTPDSSSTGYDTFNNQLVLQCWI